MDNNTQPIPTVTPEITPPSEFKGTTLQLLGWRLLGFLLSIVTLGVGAPWAQCMVYRWETSHSYVNGQPLAFDGKGHQLLGKYLLWGLLILITFGIYAIFIPVQMHKWKASHTRFAKADETQKSLSNLVILGVLVGCIAAAALLFTAVKPLIAKLPSALSHFSESILQEQNFLEDIMHNFKNDSIPEDMTDDLIGEGSFFIGGDTTVQIIDNGDGTFTVIYGNADATKDQADNKWTPDSTTQNSDNAQNEYSFTDDSRIIGGWLLRAKLEIYEGHYELTAGELVLEADGTFTYFSDLFSGGASGWHPDGIGEHLYRGNYTFYDGELTLYQTEYFAQPYSSEPGTWEPSNQVVTQQITFTDDENAVYFSDIGEVFSYGMFEPIEYCPRMTGTMNQMLDAIYPNGVQ